MSKKVSKDIKIIENCSIPGDDGSEEGGLFIVGPQEDGGREVERERRRQRRQLLQKVRQRTLTCQHTLGMATI